MPYYLTEEDNWGMDIKGLEKSVNEARRKGITVSCLACNITYSSGNVHSGWCILRVTGSVSDIRIIQGPTPWSQGSINLISRT